MACVGDLPANMRRHAPGAAWAGDKKSATAAEPFTSIDEAKTGQTVYVTCDLALLKKQWEECEMGGCDDDLLESYLGCVAKVLEVEEDDDTVNLEWATKDTQWIPILACTKTLSPAMQRHAPGAAWAGAKKSTVAAEPFTSIEECKTGETVFVTCDLALLKKQWEEAELGNVDDDLLQSYLACQGKVLEIEEDDDTVNLEWVTKDTQWMPIMACTKTLDPSMQRHAPGADWAGPGQTCCAGGGGAEDDHELIESEVPVVEV